MNFSVHIASMHILSDYIKCNHYSILSLKKHEGKGEYIYCYTQKYNLPTDGIMLLTILKNDPQMKFAT